MYTACYKYDAPLELKALRQVWKLMLRRLFEIFRNELSALRVLRGEFQKQIQTFLPKPSAFIGFRVKMPR
jgi:hypothetical protein